MAAKEAKKSSPTPNISQEVEDNSAKAPNWFVKAYILRGRNEKYAKFYDRNLDHIKFFARHMIPNIAASIIDDPDKKTIIDDINALANKANKELDKFPYTHVMLIFSVYGNVKKFQCKGKEELNFKDIHSILDTSNTLKSKLKVVIIDAFGGNEQVQALGPTQTSSGAGSNLPDGVNLLKYDGVFKNYNENIFANGSLFLRVVFHELLTQSYEKKSIDLNEVFQACKKKLNSEYISRLVECKLNYISDSTTRDPVITIHLGNTTPDVINNQYPLTFNV